MILLDLTPGTMYFFNVSSCDYEANCNISTTYNFTTTGTAPTTPTTPSTPSSTTDTYDESDASSTDDYAYYWSDVRSGDYIKFTFEDEEYKIKIVRLYDDRVKIKITPGNLEFEIPYDEKNLLDIDSNGESDIELELEEEQYYQVSVYLNTEIQQELDPTEDTNTTGTTPTGGTVIETEQIPAWKYFPVVIIILAIGYMVWIKIYKKKKKKN